jgi:hypothetical protein
MTIDGWIVTAVVWGAFFIPGGLVMRAMLLGYDDAKDMLRWHRKGYNPYTVYQVHKPYWQRWINYHKAGYFVGKNGFFGSGFIGAHAEVRGVYAGRHLKAYIFDEVHEAEHRIKELLAHKRRFIETPKPLIQEEKLELVDEGIMRPKPRNVGALSEIRDKPKETIKVITDDGYEIEARVVSKKKVEEERRKIKVGDKVYFTDGVRIHTVKTVFDTDRRVTLDNDYSYHVTRLRFATEDEIALNSQFNFKEIEMRDELAKAAIMGVAGGEYSQSYCATARAKDAYKSAEEMLRARRELQS